MDRDDGLRERLIAAGESVPATGSRDDLSPAPVDSALDVSTELRRLREDRELVRGGGRPFPEPLPAASGSPLSEVLRQAREEERW